MLLEIISNNAYSKSRPSFVLGHKKIVNLLIENGANVNEADDEGHTASQMAAKNGNSNFTIDTVD